MSTIDLALFWRHDEHLHHQEIPQVKAGTVIHGEPFGLGNHMSNERNPIRY